VSWIRRLIGGNPISQVAPNGTTPMSRPGRGAPPVEVNLDEQLLRAKHLALEIAVGLEQDRTKASGLILEAAEHLASYSGPDVPQVVEILLQVGEMAVAVDHPEAAEPLFARALAAQENQYGGGDPRLIPILISLSRVQSSTGGLENAERSLLRAIELGDRRGPPDDNAVKAMQALTIVLQHEGRLDESNRVSERLIVTAEAVHGRASPEVVEANDGLARALLQCGRPVEALAVAKRAQTLREERVGTDHPDFAEGLDTLALAYKPNGDVDTGERLQRRAVEIFDAASGESHASYGRALGNLAGTLMQRGRTNQAVPLLQRALHAKETALGPTHPSLAHTLSNLALIAAEAEAFLLAEPLMHRARDILEGSLGPQHKETARAKQLLDQIQSDLRKRDGNRAQERRVTEIEADFLEARGRPLLP
jgi:tetratricopeptide (TPR) repeat protein